MHFVREFSPFSCIGCLHRLSRPVFRDKIHVNSFRRLSGSKPAPSQQRQSSANNLYEDGRKDREKNHVEEAGGMTRRLAQMTDESLEQGGRSTQNAIKEGGFSEELKSRLEAKILDDKFKSDNPAAFAQLNMPVRGMPRSILEILTDNDPVRCRSRDSGSSSCSTMDRYRSRRRCGSSNADRRPQTSRQHRRCKNS